MGPRVGNFKIHAATVFGSRYDFFSFKYTLGRCARGHILACSHTNAQQRHKVIHRETMQCGQSFIKSQTYYRLNTY